MITAVDTNVLLDVFGADPTFGRRSEQALRACRDQGRLIACDAVLAEVVSVFGSAEKARDALGRAHVDFSSIEETTALAAGEAWSRYRAQGGRRDRIVADFLIGAHARVQADRLLTRDRGFYRSYFAGLDVLDPAT